MEAVENFYRLLTQISTETITGSLSIVAVGAVKKCKDILEKRSIESEYPIEGEYLAKYSEGDEDSKEYRRSWEYFEQSGREINGESELTVDGSLKRKSELTAEILKNSDQILGKYKAIRSVDKYSGVFYLEVNSSDDCLEGFWAGYTQSSEVGMNMDSGEYTLQPMITNFEINNIGESSLPTVESISENCLPKRNTAKLLNERSDNTVARYLRKVDRGNWRAKLLNRMSDLRVPSNPLYDGLNDEPITGFYIAEVLDSQRKAEIFPEDLNSDAVENSETVGYLRAIAVKPDHEGKGVGSRLLSDCLDQLRSQGVTVVCTVLHPESDDARLESILSHYGFENLGKIDGLWKGIDNMKKCNSSEKEPYHCASAFIKVID